MSEPYAGTSRPLRVVVLLTACINTGAVIATERRDPAVRLEDYRRALEKWVRVREVDGIVFCENSGADLSSLKAIARAATEPAPTVEFLSFYGQDFDPSLGKGRGEMRIIRHAVEHSELISRSALIIKVTGRLFVPNIAAIAKSVIRMEGVDLLCDLRKNLTWADSRVFCATSKFLRDYLLPYEEIVNDSMGVYFEHALARAAHRAMADGRRCELPSRAHRLEGVAGTNNQRIPAGVISQARRELFRLVKAFVLMR